MCEQLFQKGDIIMNEDKKIENLLEEYKDFFDTSTADISKTAKGRRFFFYTDSKCGDLYCLAEFTTADELEKIILHEMADKINMTFENIVEEINYEINYTNVSYSSCDLGEAVNRLAISLEKIQKEILPDFPMILSSLQGILTYINKYGNSNK